MSSVAVRKVKRIEQNIVPDTKRFTQIRDLVPYSDKSGCVSERTGADSLMFNMKRTGSASVGSTAFTPHEEFNDLCKNGGGCVAGPSKLDAHSTTDGVVVCLQQQVSKFGSG